MRFSRYTPGLPKSTFVALLFVPHLATASIVIDCDGAYRNRTLNATELRVLIDRHQIWHRTYETKYESAMAQNDPRKAHLCLAELKGADLTWVDLRDADLRGADLTGARLQWADLRDADLRGARLDRADLGNASLRYANLSDTSFERANLQGANLMGANLSATQMRYADLRSANLGYTNLSGGQFANAHLQGAYFSGANLLDTDFQRADLGAVVFEPSEIPPAARMSTALHLDEMTYVRTPRALLKLRADFQGARMHAQAAAITFALNHATLWRHENFADDIASVAKYTLLELPTHWGTQPIRALLALASLFLLCSFFYAFALRFPSRTQQRRETDIRTAPESNGASWRDAILWGVQFSLLASMRIGFRGHRVDRWVMRILAPNLEFEAAGWVKLCANIQVWLSIFLLASWAATSYWQPFW